MVCVVLWVWWWEINVCVCVVLWGWPNAIKREWGSECAWLGIKCIRGNDYEIWNVSWKEWKYLMSKFGCCNEINANWILNAWKENSCIIGKNLECWWIWKWKMGNNYTYKVFWKDMYAMKCNLSCMWEARNLELKGSCWINAILRNVQLGYTMTNDSHFRIGAVEVHQGGDESNGAGPSNLRR